MENEDSHDIDKAIFQSAGTPWNYSDEKWHRGCYFLYHNFRDWTVRRTVPCITFNHIFTEYMWLQAISPNSERLNENAKSIRRHMLLDRERLFFYKSFEIIQSLHQAGWQLSYDIMKRENMKCRCGRAFPPYSEPSFQTIRDLFKGIKYILRGTPYPLVPEHREDDEVDRQLLTDIGEVYEQTLRKYEVKGFEQSTFKAAGLIDIAMGEANEEHQPTVPLPTPASWKQAWSSDQHVMYALDKMTFPAMPPSKPIAVDTAIDKQFTRFLRLLEESKSEEDNDKEVSHQDDEIEPEDYINM
ncbi:unnamed protein product [Trichogramma brassicae]|uniref:Uncharacterized protein n=1 Tax=Trichogramma brassicae TaxID=86971 RepID=A0A6H5J6B3_9HYME|nr:unnamed protein product [Trichogramma brassicae]